jgi:hypothetical protein
VTTASYIRTNTFIRYDGSNGAEIASIMGRTILSDTGTVLTFVPSPPLTFTDTFQLGDAFSPRAGFFLKADFEAQYVTASSMTPQPPQPDQVGTMDAVSVSVPILLLGASVERTIVWNRAFPDANYALTYLPDANTIGKINVAVKAGTVPTKSGLTITISAGLALTVAGVLHVMGTTKATGTAKS